MIRAESDAHRTRVVDQDVTSSSPTASSYTATGNDSNAAQTIVLSQQDVETIQHRCDGGDSANGVIQSLQNRVDNMTVANSQLLVPAGNDPAEQTETEEQIAPPFSVLDSCKAWLSSMVVHVLGIIVLAILTMDLHISKPVSLTMGVDDGSDLSFIHELTINTSKWEDIDQPQTTEDQELPPELLEIELLAETNETENTDAFENILSPNPMGGGGNPSSDATGMGSTAGASSSSFFGIDAKGNRIVYIVDRSGSMTGQRWLNASGELIKSLEALKPEQKFFVYLFSSSSHPMPRLAGKGKLVPATKENVKQVKKWLLRQEPDSKTNPMSSVRQALRLNPDTIFLLTDGKFGDNTGPYLVNRAEMRRNTSDQHPVVINTIAFHCDHYDFLMMLRSIALSYSGTFRHVE